MSDPIRVPMTRAEVYQYALTGACRTLSARLQGRQLEEGRSDLGFDRDILGYIGEVAVAKHLNIFPLPKIGRLDTYEGDLPGLQCKSVLWRSYGLIVRKHDPADFNYVLAYVNFKEIRSDTSPFFVDLQGWLHGSDAKNEAFWVDSDPQRKIHQAAYFVPLAQLHPMATLPRQ